MITNAAIRITEGSGPSGMNGNGWCRIVVSNNFVTSRIDLRKAFAYVVQKLFTDLVETYTIEAFQNRQNKITIDKIQDFDPLGLVTF